MLRKTYKDDNGYLRFNNSNKLVHRWVVEINIGRNLLPNEVIHHRDGNKLNNSIENLLYLQLIFIRIRNKIY